MLPGWKLSRMAARCWCPARPPSCCRVLDGGVSLRDLGRHRLKDLGRPEQVFQLEADCLDGSFPVLASLDNPELPNNLPTLLSAFVGREAEVAEIRVLVESARLLTLTGAGGSGKTRLALQAAAELLGSCVDGAWFADLAPVTDGNQIAAVVASALGLPDTGLPMTERVTRALTGQQVLIVLDNCEHVIDAAAKFCDQVLQHCLKTQILVTSREPLGIDGEQVYRVPSLSLPPADARTSADLTGSDAVRLFAERARATDPRFSLTDQSAWLVGSICRQLDGIPLALELAAARLSSMSLQQISERLDQRFRLLTGGSRNAMPRQQTLQATVDWSFGLLNQAELGTLLRLSVFTGGFDLAAAEGVCTSESADAFDVLDLVGSLVDKSLVIADRAEGGVRYRLLETIRQYGAQQLLSSAGAAEVLRVRDRHAQHYLGLAEAAAPELDGPGQAEWLARLDAEWDNFRAALGHLAGQRRGIDSLRLGVALSRFAEGRGHGEILGHLRLAVQQAEEAVDPPPELLARSLLAMSWSAHLFERGNEADLAEALRRADRALAIARECGDRRLEARAMRFCYVVGSAAAAPEFRQQLRQQAIGIARETGDVHLLGELLGSLAMGSADERRRDHREALECFRRCGDDLGAAGQLHALCGLDMLDGQLAEAEAHLAEAIALAEPLGGELYLFVYRMDQALLLLIQGKHASAEPIVRGSLLVARRIGLLFAIGEDLLAAACVASWRGQHDKAARLHGAADVAIARELADHTISWSAAERRLQQREQDQLREMMGEQAYRDACRAGAGLSVSDAVALALRSP